MGPQQDRPGRVNAAALLLALLILASPLAVVGQALIADHFRESWHTADGLPHNLVNGIVQTPDGYLWFATWEGLARFNGREFTVFDRDRLPGLSDAGVRALHVAHDGKLWIGGARGSLARLDSQQWTFFEPAAGLINALLLDRAGRLWIATESDGLERLDADGSRHRFLVADGLAANGVHSLAEDDRGRLWIGTALGVSVFESGALRSLPVDAGLPSGRVFALHAWAEELLVGTERGPYTYDGHRFEALHAELVGDAVTSITRARDGELWLGTVNRGLVRISAAGVERFGVDRGLPNNRVLALLRDRDGHIWAGTNGGLMRFRSAPFSTYTRAQGLPDDYVRAVMEHSNGSVWIGTSNGLGRLTGGAPGEIHRPQELAGHSILSLAEGREGEVWIGTYANGLLHWRDGRIVAHYRRDSGLGGNEVRSLLPASDGLWVGTSNGLTRIRDGHLQTWHVADGMPGEFVVALHQDAGGRLWIGTGTGLAVMQEGVIRRIDISGMDRAEFVFGFHESDDGSLWIATDRGLVRYRDGTLGHVGRAQGMPFDKIFNVTADLDGYFWIGSNRGVLRIAQVDADAAADGERSPVTFTLFGEADGMFSAQCNGGSEPSAILRGDGSVWFATAHGAAAVQPQRLPSFMALAAPAAIETFRVDGVAQSLWGPHRLPAGTGRVEFGYAGLAFVTPHRIRYRSRLDGFDRDWVERGSQHSAEFTNLLPGQYTFRVRAAYPGSDWDGPEASLSFSIAPLVWQRPLFWWLLLLGTVVLALAGFQFRLRHLQRNQRLLREQVEQRTGDLREQAERLQAADVEKTRLLSQLRQQSEAFERQAREDELTGLANRRAFDERLATEFARARRSGSSLCLALVDIDHFKQVNDLHSHAVGDRVLRLVAEQMRIQCRGIDSVSRWGGEEFALLFPYTELEDAVLVCDRLRAAIEAMDFSGVAPGLQVTVSIGVASCHGLGQHEKLVSLADKALYRAKQSGRNLVCR
jgi:diguanylate cyclase (GGDEF)-like protein